MNPLSKSKAKYIKSLQLKKNRVLEGKFIVEGEKSVREFLSSDYEVDTVVATEDFYRRTDPRILPPDVYLSKAKILAGLGSFQSNNTVLAIVCLKPAGNINLGTKEVVLALDEINDPGNLGTIIRIADWFGINNVLVSLNTVDVYSPKVISASKGSLTRVNVFYIDLVKFLADYQGRVVAADLDGEPLTSTEPVSSGVLLMGSEAHGISKQLLPYITEKTTIPRLGGAESLNVAVATGIICNSLVSVKR
jgi:RNA methyltransferase, TrmH family